MNKFLTIVALILASQSAFALTPETEICALQSDDTELYLDKETIFDIKKTKHVAPQIEQMILEYYNSESGEKVTLAELREAFIEGDENYNDLYVFKYTSKASGLIYFEVRTYPGDNPYGVVYSEKTGLVVASNGDSDYSLVDGTWCGDIIK